MKSNIKYYLILSLIFILLFSLFFKSNSKYELFEKNNMKNAIVVLTRGYQNNNEYQILIDRNKSIYDIFYSKLKDKTLYDIIIFHEGNITRDQQIYIQYQTPELPLIFIPISFIKKEINNPKCPNTELSNSFSNGYKNMCYFWSISFLEYLKDYNYIIRIDEDCIINKLNPNILYEYQDNNIMFSSPTYQPDDDPDVIKGLKELFDNYLYDNNKIQKNELKMPYTNFMIVNIPFFKNNIDVINILNQIDKSECVFSNRWGDLPIWGYILSYLIDKKYYIEDKSISYQ
jgi:hypothetical protein